MIVPEFLNSGSFSQ